MPKKATRLTLFQNFHRHLPQQAAEDLHHVPEIEEREAEEETKALLIIVANMWRKLEKNEEKTSANFADTWRKLISIKLSIEKNIRCKFSGGKNDNYQVCGPRVPPNSATRDSTEYTLKDSFISKKVLTKPYQLLRLYKNIRRCVPHHRTRTFCPVHILVWIILHYWSANG